MRTASFFALIAFSLTAGAQSFTLTVNKAGPGNGTVTSSPAGINCGGTCSASFASGVAVVLNATPADPTSYLASWSGGGCSGTGCTVTMDADKAVTATFGVKAATTTSLASDSNPHVWRRNFTLTATVAGGVAPTGTVAFRNGSTVICAAAPLSAGQATCTTSTLAVGTHTLTAAYSGDGDDAPSSGTLQQVVDPSYQLTITQSNWLLQRGTITTTPAGISCTQAQQPQTCTNYYRAGSNILLSAAPFNGQYFAGWRGGNCPFGVNPCSLTMSSDLEVRASFGANGQPVPIVSSSNSNAQDTQLPTITLWVVLAPPDGTQISVQDGATVLCTAPMTSGQAQCTPAALPLGTRPISGTYVQGGTPYGDAVTQTVYMVVTVVKVGNGQGTVATQDNSLHCGVNCSKSALSPVTLIGQAAPASNFDGWSGAGCSGTGTCVVSASATVNAAFNLSGFAISPTSVDFGRRSMGTSSPVRIVTVTNSTAVPVTVTGVSVNNTQFPLSHDCATVPAGGSCTIGLRFAPIVQSGAVASSQDYVSVLTVTSDAPSSPNTAITYATAEKSLVSHYYRAILQRAPDAGGTSFWNGEAVRLRDLGANVNETWFAMAKQFYASAEYSGFNRDDSAYVTDLYNTFYNRQPDSGGQSFWLGQMASGLPREAVLLHFMFAPEFADFTQSIFGNTAARAEVDMVMDFYRGILGRLPDSSGFQNYVGRFRSAQCQGSAAVYSEVEAISSAFIQSAEYGMRGRNTTQFVADLYDAFLRRGPDSAGLAFWIGEIDNGRRNRDQVRRDYRDSPEFSNRVSRLLSEPCLPQ